MKNHYTAAVLELLQAGQEPATVVRGLQTILKKRGHEQLLPMILRAVVRQLEAGKGEEVIVVTVAKEADAQKLKAEIEAALNTLSAKEEPAIAVDDTIIGGFIATTNTKVLDQSHKHKLVKLYRSITTK